MWERLATIYVEPIYEPSKIRHLSTSEQSNDRRQMTQWFCNGQLCRQRLSYLSLSLLMEIC